MSDTDRSEILALFRGVFDAWNLRDASGMAGRFDEDGELIAFDGSELRGRVAIESELRRIFSDHPTGTYVASVRDVDQLHPAIAVVRAVAGLVPPGQGDIDPKTEM